MSGFFFHALKLSARMLVMRAWSRPSPTDKTEVDIFLDTGDSWAAALFRACVLAPLWRLCKWPEPSMHRDPSGPVNLPVFTYRRPHTWI